MQIKTSIDKTTSFEEFLNIAKAASPHVSLLGCRYVTVENYDGFLYLDDLPNRINNFIKEKKFEFSEKEREIGKQLNEIYRQILMINYYQVEFCNLFTYILAAFRNEFSKINKFRFDDTYQLNSFNYYTRQQYIDTFGFSPVKESDTQKRWLPPTREEIRAHKIFFMRWVS